MTDLTRFSLILRLKDRDEDAWDEFVELYEPCIKRWAFRRGLQSADVDDVANRVLMKLYQYFPSFEYDQARGRFRSYLAQVTQSAVNDLFNDWKRVVQARNESASRFLNNILTDPNADSDLLSTLEEEQRLDLARISEQLARERCESEHVWKCFELAEVEGIPSAEVARTLGLKIAQVYSYRSRVKKLIQEEFRKLDR